MEQGKIRKDRLISGAIVLIAAIAIILTGTLAYVDNSQHKTNPFAADDVFDVTLNDEFTPPANWEEGTEVDKKVSVTNNTSSTQDAYVRVNFKEYMESYILVPVQESGEDVLFATYVNGAKKGEFMSWADAQAGDFDYTKYTVTYADGTTADFARTVNAEERNGIYGKAMYIPGPLNIYGTADKANYPDQEHAGQETDECEYNIHFWGDSATGIANRTNATDFISDYMSWLLGEDVVLMSEWDGIIGDFWILDDTDTTEGWAYWANPLQPGQSTSNIMESVTLSKMPGVKGGSLEYYIHIDMETVTLNELSRTDGKAAWNNSGDDAGTKSSDAAKELIKEWTADSESFVFDTTKGVSNPALGSFNEEVILQIVDDPNNNYSVDWGDGTVTKNYATHTYATPGIYTITIKGSRPGGINFSAENRLIQVLTPLLPKTSGIMSYQFARCTNLTSVPANLFSKNQHNVALQGVFYQCANLEEIPSGLFDEQPLVQTFEQVFSGCFSISAIPSGLFDKNIAVTTFDGAFAGTAITVVPEGLFDNNIAVGSFRQTFINCINLTELPEYWDTVRYPQASYPQFYTIHTQMFRDCTGASNYADAPITWTQN